MELILVAITLAHRDSPGAVGAYANVVCSVELSPEHTVLVSYFCLKWLL